MAAFVASQPPRWKPVALTWVARTFARLRRFVQIRQTERALHELPDYLLKDVGIRRCEIEWIAERLVDNPHAEPRPPRRTLAY